MDPEESKKRRTQQECEFMCVPMSMWKSMVSRGLPQSSGSSDTMHMQGSGYSDPGLPGAFVTHTRDMQSSGVSDTMSNVSRSWIAVNRSDLDEYGPDDDEEFDTWWSGVTTKEENKEELFTEEEKEMDLDDTQDREELAKDEEKGQVSP